MGDKPDELAAAERVVVDLNLRLFQDPTHDVAWELNDAVLKVICLRAAQASQGSGG